MAYTKPQLSRRSFLKGSAGIAAGATLAIGFPTPAIGKNHTIRVLTVGDPFQFTLRDLIPEFEAKTGIHVDFESVTYEVLHTRLVSAFLSDTPDADVVNVDQMWTGQYIDNGWIQPLSRFAKGDAEFDIEDIIPEVLHSINTWRGQLATVTIGASCQGVIYRKSLFEKAGLAAPSEKWTWDEYTEILRTLSHINGLYGTVVTGAQPVPIVHMFSQLSASFGARWFEKFPDAATWDFTPRMNEPEMVKAIELYKTLYSLSPKESINYNWYAVGNRFSRGDIGMFYHWSDYFTLVNNTGYMNNQPSAVVGDIGIVPCPSDGDRASKTSLGGWALGVPTTSEKPAEAWEFIKWSTSAEVQKKMGLNRKYGHMFSNFSRNSLFEDKDLLEVYPFLPQTRAILNRTDGKLARPPVPIYTELESILGHELGRVLKGQKSAQEAANYADTQFRKALKRNYFLPYTYPSFDDNIESTNMLIEFLANKQ